MLDKPLIAKCFIYDVVCWPFFSPIINHIIFAALSLFDWREGLEGSCRKFGLWVVSQRLRHVPESEGKGI
jgi:hypothetical protein